MKFKSEADQIAGLKAYIIMKHVPPIEYQSYGCMKYLRIKSLIQQQKTMGSTEVWLLLKKPGAFGARSKEQRGTPHPVCEARLAGQS